MGLIVLMYNIIYLFTYLLRRGTLLSTAIFVYAATSPVTGYTGASLYSRIGGTMYMYTVCMIHNYTVYKVAHNILCVHYTELFY